MKIIKGLIVSALATISVQALSQVKVAAYGDISNFGLNWSEIATIRENDWGGHHNSMIFEFYTNLEKQDIYFIDTGMLGEYINRFELKDLTDYFEPHKSEYYPYAVEQGIDTLGKQRAIPLGIGVGVQYYRTDLLESAGITKTQLSGTWQEYLQAARTAKSNGYYINDNSDTLLRLYIYSHLNNGDFLFTNKDGDFGIDLDFHKQAYEFIKQFHDEELSFETGMWNTSWYNSFKQDRMLGSIQGVWLTHHLSGWIAVDQIGKFEIIKTPGDKTGNWGGSHIIVNPDSSLEEIKPVLDLLIGAKEYSTFEAALNENVFESARIDMLDNYDDEYFGEYFNQPAINSVVKQSIQKLPIIRTHPLDAYAQTLYFSKYYQMMLADEITPEDAIDEMNQLLNERLSEITLD